MKEWKKKLAEKLAERQELYVGYYALNRESQKRRNNTPSKLCARLNRGGGRGRTIMNIKIGGCKITDCGGNLPLRNNYEPERVPNNLIHLSMMLSLISVFSFNS
jgi:hypothetical protein